MFTSWTRDHILKVCPNVVNGLKYLHTINMLIKTRIVSNYDINTHNMTTCECIDLLFEFQYYYRLCSSGYIILPSFCIT